MSNEVDQETWIPDEVQFWREALHQAALNEPIGILRRMHEALNDAQRRQMQAREVEIQRSQRIQ